MIVRLLGPLEIEIDGRVLRHRDMGGLKPKQLLEILLVHRGHIVTKQRLAEYLWDSRPPDNVARTLEGYVSRLRHSLEPAARHPRDCRFIRTEPRGYRFAVDGAEVDLDAFNMLRRQGRLQDLQRALSLVRGDALEDEPEGHWAVSLRDRCRAHYRDTLVRAAAGALAEGLYEAALGYAEEALSLDPTQEAPYRTIMLAAAALGQQNIALRAFVRCRRALAEELGADPSPLTTKLHLQLLRPETQVIRARAVDHIRVLVIDSDATSRRAAAQLVGAAPGRLTTVPTVSAALNRVAHEEFNFIVCVSSPDDHDPARTLDALRRITDSPIVLVNHRDPRSQG